MRTIITIFTILLFSGSGLQAQIPAQLPAAVNDTASYPYWIEMMKDPAVNFFNVQRAFNLYWKDRPITKGCGWKPFKRWEYIMMNRINPDGSRPSTDETYKAYTAIKKSVRSSGGN